MRSVVSIIQPKKATESPFRGTKLPKFSNENTGFTIRSPSIRGAFGVFNPVGGALPCTV